MKSLRYMSEKQLKARKKRQHAEKMRRATPGVQKVRAKRRVRNRLARASRRANR